jgi:hypothetical protein
MPRFVLVLRDNGDEMQALTPEQNQALIAQYWAWTDQIRREGHHLGGEALKVDGLTVRERDGQTVVDGPYAETKESVGGFYIIQAPDLAAAAEIAKGCPAVMYHGSVEVREIHEWD